MVWGLCGALSAGILNEPRILIISALIRLVFIIRENGSARRAVAFALLATCFYAYGQRAIELQCRRVALFRRWHQLSGAGLALRGWVSSYPRLRFGWTQFRFTTTLDGVELVVEAQAHAFTIDYGDSLLLEVAPSRRQSRPVRRTLASGTVGRVRVADGGVVALGGKGGNWLRRRVFWPAHRHIRTGVARGLGSHSGVPLALALGERGYLSRATSDAFKTLGISHLLALSGLHLGFVAAAVLVLLRLLRRRGGIPLLLALAGFVATVGEILSLYRAFVMAAVLIAASATRRPLRPIAALAGAYLVMLIVYPQAMFAVAFQLSFMATFGVLLVVRRLPAVPARPRRARVGVYVASSMVVSTGAQVAVAPIVLSVFGSMSGVSPLMTLVFLPPVTTLLGATLVCAAVGMVDASIAGALYSLLGTSTLWFERAVQLVASHSPSPLVMPAPDWFTYYTGLAVLWVARRRTWLYVVAVTILTVSFCLGRAAGALS